jgi:hypothetical protein
MPRCPIRRRRIFKNAECHGSRRIFDHYPFLQRGRTSRPSSERHAGQTHMAGSLRVNKQPSYGVEDSVTSFLSMMTFPPGRQPEPIVEWRTNYLTTLRSSSSKSSAVDTVKKTGIKPAFFSFRKEKNFSPVKGRIWQCQWPCLTLMKSDEPTV